jgi:hypothetical protein
VTAGAPLARRGVALRGSRSASAPPSNSTTVGSCDDVAARPARHTRHTPHNMRGQMLHKHAPCRAARNTVCVQRMRAHRSCPPRSAPPASASAPGPWRRKRACLPLQTRLRATQTRAQSACTAGATTRRTAPPTRARPPPRRARASRTARA